jgi:hypothetical protein
MSDKVEEPKIELKTENKTQESKPVDVDAVTLSKINSKRKSNP